MHLPIHVKEYRMNKTDDGNQRREAVQDALLVRAAQQDSAQFDALYARWLKPIYRYFYFRLGSIKDAEDLTSQVFLQVYRDLPHYHSRGTFSAWLFAIAHARLVDFYRKDSHKAAREIPIENLEIPSGSMELSAQTVQKAEIEQVFKILNNLNENEQRLIRLRFMAELSYHEIGQVLHCKEDSARKSVAHILERVKNQLENEHD
jgi:RNA polymerase sigma-70 factor (ECF subfamily)